MTSATNTIGTVSPQQASTTQGLRSPRRAAWTDIFGDYAVRHMAATGVMSLKIALEVLIENDSKETEQTAKG